MASAQSLRDTRRGRDLQPPTLTPHRTASHQANPDKLVDIPEAEDPWLEADPWGGSASTKPRRAAPTHSMDTTKQTIIKFTASSSEAISPKNSVSIVLLSGEPLAAVACASSGLTFRGLWDEVSEQVLSFVGKRWEVRRPWQLLLTTDEAEANVINVSEFVDLFGTIVKSPGFPIPCGSQLQLLVLDPWSGYWPSEAQAVPKAV